MTDIKINRIQNKHNSYIYYKQIKNISSAFNTIKIDNKYILLLSHLYIYYEMSFFKTLFGLVNSASIAYMEMQKLDIDDASIELIINKNKEKQFIYLCQIGNLNAIKKMHETKYMDIHEYAAIGFYSASSFNHLKVVKWLYSMFPHIRTTEHYSKAFYIACHYDFVDIAKYIYSLGGINLKSDGQISEIIRACDCKKVFRWARKVDRNLFIRTL